MQVKLQEDFFGDVTKSELETYILLPRGSIKTCS
jgi:hypothetical protein